MNSQEACAYVIAQAAALNARIAGMVAENQWRLHVGQAMAYNEVDFQLATKEYCVEHNDVIGLFQKVH